MSLLRTLFSALGPARGSCARCGHALPRVSAGRCKVCGLSSTAALADGAGATDRGGASAHARASDAAASSRPARRAA